MNNAILSILALVFTMLFVSCTSGSVPPMQRDFSDAVTNINQVDPRYRAYFRAQHGANYTLADQRRAYLAAMQTARTPVRASDYRAASRSRLASRSSRKAQGKRHAVASRKGLKGKKGKATRRAVASRSSRARGGTKASRKRATASRRTATRRTSRRRG